MNTSTALRIRMVKKMVADLYEPGRQDRNKQWVLRTAVAPLLGISRRTFTRYLHTPDADVARAAKELAQHIKDYRISTTDQLDKETGLLVNFIADLETKFATQVTTLSLTAFVTNLKEANERVRTLTLQRTEDRMALPIGAMKTARATSDEAYRQLVKMVNALALVFGEADYADFIDYVNTEIVHFKREVLNQKASTTTTPSTPNDNSSSSSNPSNSSNPSTPSTGDTGGTGSDDVPVFE